MWRKTWRHCKEGILLPQRLASLIDLGSLRLLEHIVLATIASNTSLTGLFSIRGSWNFSFKKNKTKHHCLQRFCKKKISLEKNPVFQWTQSCLYFGRTEFLLSFGKSSKSDSLRKPQQSQSVGVVTLSGLPFPEEFQFFYLPAETGLLAFFEK